MPNTSTFVKEGVLTDVDDLFICLMDTEETATTGPKYATEIIRTPVIVELGIKLTETNGVFYASGKPFASFSNVSGLEITLNAANIPSELLARLLGKEYNKGAAFTKAKAQKPYFALGFAGKNHDGTQKMVWLFKGVLNYPEEKYKTSGEEVEAQASEFTAKFFPLANNNAMRFDLSTADKDAEATYEIAKFFDQVIFDETELAKIAKP